MNLQIIDFDSGKQQQTLASVSTTTMAEIGILCISYCISLYIVNQKLYLNNDIMVFLLLLWINYTLTWPFFVLEIRSAVVWLGLWAIARQDQDRCCCWLAFSYLWLSCCLTLADLGTEAKRATPAPPLPPFLIPPFPSMTKIKTIKNFDLSCQLKVGPFHSRENE